MVNLYETDFHAWALEQASKVREGRFDGLDVENVAEELESLGKSERSELRRHFELYLMHKLKWDYQPERQTRSWDLTMREQHRQALRAVHENPSLKPLTRGLFADAYKGARVLTLNETGLDEDLIPEECTYTFEDCFPELSRP